MTESFEAFQKQLTVKAEISHSEDAHAYLVEDQRQVPYLYWNGPLTWGESVLQLLEANEVKSLEPVAQEVAHEYQRILLSGPPQAAIPFQRERWAQVPGYEAVLSLQAFARFLGQIHARQMFLGGIRRSDIYFDPDTGQLFLVAMTRLTRNPAPASEDSWRDMRIIGELLYENFMKDEYPGGHQMASMLQDRQIIAEAGLVAPGMPQVVAGCVSPYGDLAYADTEDVWDGLEQLRLEIEEPLSFEVGASSSMGNYIFRKNNQDSCGHIEVKTICGSRKVSLGFFCVADGIGGIQDGEKASGLAVHTACQAFARAWAHYGADRIRDSIVRFARDITKVVAQRLALEGEFSPSDNRGGTTFSGLLIVGNRAGVAHVGDSRVMLLRDGKLIHLTHDHTLASILIELGELTPEQAANHDLSQRTISRFLTTAMEVEQDRIDGFRRGLQEEIPEAYDPNGIKIRRGDLFLLTSDGAHGEIEEDELRTLLTENARSPQVICDLLVENALKKVGRDNATALALRVY